MNSKHTKPRILLVEDSVGWARIVQRTVMELAECVWVSTMREARWEVQCWEPDCVLLDLGLPDSDPQKTVDTMRSLYSGPIVVVTGEDSCDHEYVLHKDSSATPAAIKATITAAMEVNNTRQMIRKLHPRGLFVGTLVNGAAALADSLHKQGVT